MICPLSLSISLIAFWSRALCPTWCSLGREKSIEPRPFNPTSFSAPFFCCRWLRAQPVLEPWSSRAVVEQGCPWPSDLATSLLVPWSFSRLGGVDTYLCDFSPRFPVLLSQLHSLKQEFFFSFPYLFFLEALQGTFSRVCFRLATRNRIRKKNLHYPV